MVTSFHKARDLFLIFCLRRNYGFQKIIFVIVGICIFLLSACGPKALAPEAELDTPMHHVKNGNKLLKSGKIEDAFREFNRAKELDPKCTPAYLGLGLAHGLKGESDEGFNAMKKAERYAEDKEQNAAVNVGYHAALYYGRRQADKELANRSGKPV